MLINLMGGLTSRCTPISNHHVALIDFKYITILSILHDKDEKIDCTRNWIKPKTRE